MNTTTIPPDIIEAIGNPPSPSKPTNEIEYAFWLKCRARHAIDNHIINNEDDVRNHFLTHTKWMENCDFLKPETLTKWIKFEQMFCASCIKYLRELDEIKASFK